MVITQSKVSPISQVSVIQAVAEGQDAVPLPKNHQSATSW